MKEKIIATILFLSFLLFSGYYLLFQNRPFVLNIISPNIIQVDLNGNHIPDKNETICVEDIETFTAKISTENEKLAKRFGISNEDAIKIGYLTDSEASSLLAGQFVKVKLSKKKSPKCQFGKIYIENSNYADILYDNGFAIKNSENYNQKAFEKLLAKAQKLELVILNKKNLKYHTLNCKYGKMAKESIIIKKNELPTSSSPCKFCHNGKKNSKQPAGINAIKAPQNAISDGNLTLILTDFTTILKPDRHCNHQACKSFVELINSSQNSIDIALYGWANIPKVDDAINKAIARGVKIRLVYDTAINKPSYYTETENFVSRFTDRKSDEIPQNKKLTNMLMHNKFAIFDNQKVFTGSMNYSTTGFSGFNHNSILIINSAQIANLYKNEFNQMYGGNFHTQKGITRNNKNLKISNSDISVFFSPQDKGLSKDIIPIIKNAKKYIYIPTFILTHKELTEELIAAKKRNVDVKIIIDATSTGITHSKFKELRENEIPIKVENYAGKMHAKSMIIDDTYIIIGSANFSSSGENKNDENMLLIKNPKLAKFYREYFEYFWAKIPDKYLKYTVGAESKYSIGSCSDGIDNDFDGKIDLSDEGCKKRN